MTRPDALWRRPGNMLKLEPNEALWDRILRVCLGIAMLAIGWAQVVDGVWGLALQIFGWVPLLTGLLAVRFGKRIEWDSVNLKAKNCPEAEPFIHKAYRAGYGI